MKDFPRIRLYCIPTYTTRAHTSYTHTHTVEYYSAIKNENLPFAVTWMAVENIILSEMSDKNKYCVTTYLWNLKNTTN